MRKGLFPENSLGESEKLNYLTWGIKAGGDYRITGRHLIYSQHSHCNKSTALPQFFSLAKNPQFCRAGSSG